MATRSVRAKKPGIFARQEAETQEQKHNPESHVVPKDTPSAGR
jgi:hypothetical protein